jgi:hypothetical protein
MFFHCLDVLKRVVKSFEMKFRKYLIKNAWLMLLFFLSSLFFALLWYRMLNRGLDVLGVLSM